MKDKIEELIQTALEARKYAYAPYSGFSVGAALLCADGTVYTGCNIENAAFSPTNCAERTAIFKAVSEGKRDFVSIAIVGGHGDKMEAPSPCGICRQVMAEFCKADTFQVIMAKSPEDYVIWTLSELLPAGFSL